jgi:WD40 repeat protein
MPGVFISYAREDLQIARRLYDALASAGREPTWDQDHQAVPFSARWRPEIQAAIENSDKFVFLISPDSLDSVPCANELAHATGVNKQVIPIVVRAPREGQPVPNALEELNWIFLTDDAGFDRAFGQLTTALDTDLSWTKAHTRLLGRSSEWTAANQDRSLLLHGTDLRTAEEWLADAGHHAKTPPTDPQRAYIAASRRAADMSARRWRGALAGGLVIALVLATVAFIQRNQASHEAGVAQARALAAEATADLTTDPAQSLQQALQSTQINPGAAGITALRLALAADHTRMAFQPGFGTGTQATWSPATEIIAATGHGNSVQLWNPRTGRLLRVLGALPAADPVSQLSYNRQGTLLAAVATNGRVALWDPSTGSTVNLSQLNADLRADLFKPEFASDPALAGIWNPQTGDLYLYGSVLHDILVYRPATAQIFTLNMGNPVPDMAFAPTGSRAFILQETGSGAEYARIANFGNGTSVTVPRPADLGGWGIDQRACWTPDGSEIVTWDPTEAQDETLRVFSPKTGAELFERAGATYSAAACGATSAEGPYVAAGDYQGEGTLLQTRNFGPYAGSHEEFTAIGLYGHTQRINAVATSSDGDYIATGGDDGTLRIWDAVLGTQLSLIDAGQPVESVQFSPDGGAVLAVAANGTVLVEDAGVGEPDVVLQAPGAGSTYALGFADGSQLVYGVNEITQASQDGDAPKVTGVTIMLWHAATGAVAASYRLPAPPQLGSTTCPAAQQGTFCQFGAPAQEFSGFTVSPDGQHFAYAAAGEVVARSFKGSHAQVLRLPAPATGVTFAGPADDLVVKTNQDVDIWRPFGGGHLIRIPQPSAPLDAELSADGSRLATANAGGSAMLWDASTGGLVTRFVPHPVSSDVIGAPRALRVAVNSGGTALAVGTDHGSVDLWRVQGHRLLTTLVMRNAVRQDVYPIAELSFADSGSYVVAVNYPQIEAGDELPPGSALILAAATGRTVAALGSPAQDGPPVNPGVALSPDGGYVLGGVEGFSPATAEAGNEAIYGVADSQEFVNLQNTLTQAPPVYPIGPNLIPVNPWAANGIQLLTGGPAVYACDSCGSLAQMQSAARLRLAWATALTPAHDDPPSGDAFS